MPKYMIFIYQWCSLGAIPTIPLLIQKKKANKINISL